MFIYIQNPFCYMVSLFPFINIFSEYISYSSKQKIYRISETLRLNSFSLYYINSIGLKLNYMRKSYIYIWFSDYKLCFVLLEIFFYSTTTKKKLHFPFIRLKNTTNTKKFSIHLKIKIFFLLFSFYIHLPNFISLSFFLQQ